MGPETATPARLYALVAGAGLTLLGIAGFFYGSSFDTGTRAIRAELGEVLGVFAVNGWTNVLHLVTGLLALALATRSARNLALGLGLAYILLAIWGLLTIDRGVGEILGVFAVNSATCILWLLVGLAGTAAGAASGELPAMPKRNPRERPRLRRSTRERSEPAAQDPAPAPAPLDPEAERAARRRERRARRSSDPGETGSA
ncbi:DUF4383 domain-containing protein [Thermoleophilia bacterium SCSIO 60948]|nr:DUF4383 domain-containing protein [Thermoleophilia bacterium SCSIO 60948]